jgi:hypothetical protein
MKIPLYKTQGFDQPWFTGPGFSLCVEGMVQLFPHVADKTKIEITIKRRNPKKAGFKKMRIHNSNHEITFNGGIIRLVIGYGTFVAIRDLGLIDVDFWIRVS